jgi:Tfp pilus assembly protein PilV
MTARIRTSERAAGRRTDEGVSLIEVIVAFTILLIALIPLSYLFTTSLVSAGQTVNQQTALSIAEKWVETLSNITPPVNANGEVIVNKSLPPAAADPGFSNTTTSYTVTTTPVSPTSVAITSTSTFALATTATPQTAVVTTTVGGVSTPQTITYTGFSGNTLTGVSGWTAAGSISSGAAVSQSTVSVSSETKGGTVYSLLSEYQWTTAQNGGSGSKPNLCLAGTPQLLKVRVSVSWGPNKDTNNVQDSVVLNYPPAGIQTLGFIALQVNGDNSDVDTQANPWSERVQAPPVQISGPQNLTIYPDSYGCAFAQLPASTGGYTVAIVNATSGILAGAASNTTYGSPSFVANGVLGNVSGNELTQPQSVTQTSVSVNVGAVTRLTASYDQGSIINLSYPSSSATEDGVACPGAVQIACISSGESGTGTGLGTNTAAVLTVFNPSTGQWAGAAVPGTVTRITSEACSGTVRCVAVGIGSGGGVILSSPTTSASFTADTVPTTTPAIASLSQVVCPTGTSYCVAIGATTTGTAVALTGTVSAGSIAWTADAISGTGTIAGLSNLICPASAGGCVATGISTSPTPGTPIIVAGGYGLGWTATSPTPTVTLTTLTSLACPSTTVSTVCLIAGRTSTGPALVSGTAPAGLGVAAPAWTWKADTLPTGTSTLTGLYCPSALKCLLTGTNNVPAPVIIYGATTPSTSVTFASDTVPAGVTATQMACPTATACVIIGLDSNANLAILSGAINLVATTADTWTSAIVPTPSGATLTKLSQLVCWTSPACAITTTATVTATGKPTALLLASTGTGSPATMTSWNFVTLPTANPALYLTDIDCVQPGGSSNNCTAVGASAAGAVELSSSTGPAGTWADTTPSGLSGFTALGVPVQMGNVGLAPNPSATLITAGWTTSPATPLPPVFPFTGGYGLWAGDCLSEDSPGFNVGQVATVPGGTSATTTVPLGLFSVQVLHSIGSLTGLPYSGVALTLTATTTGCNGDTYNLQTTGVDGLSRTEVPYGTYSLKIVAAGTTTVTGITVGGSSVAVGLVPYLLPTPIPESVS